MDLRGFPVFTGCNLESWIEWLEDYFVFHHFTDDNKLNLSTALMKEDAYEWLQRCESLQSWNEMKRELRFQFESPPRIVLSKQHIEEIQRDLVSMPQESLATLTTKIARIVDSVVLEQAPQRHVADAEKIVEDDGASVMVKSEKYVPEPHNETHRSLQVPIVPKVPALKPPCVLLDRMEYRDIMPSVAANTNGNRTAHQVLDEMTPGRNNIQKLQKEKKSVASKSWMFKYKRLEISDKGLLLDGTKVVVKGVTDFERPGGDEAFQRENLSAAYCLREIRPGDPILDRFRRKHIALGATRGLEYLHEHCNQKTIHSEVKAANVLLDEDCEAVVGDFGLAKLVDVRRTNVTTHVRGTMGHIAPECISTGKSPEKTNVFGYGILLLELVTGQRAIDFSRLEEEESVFLRHSILERKRVKLSVWFKKIKVKIKGNAIRELLVEKSEQESSDDSTRVVNVRDNSERTFYEELVQVIELSDVIVEVLDARDPLGTRCTIMERMVMQAGPNKHLVLLLNKIDLVPRESAEKWLKYLREEFPAVAFKCSTQEQRSNLGCKSYKASKPSNIL